jgi:hypothetical protein
MLSQNWQRILIIEGDAPLSAGIEAALADLAAKLRLAPGEAVSRLEMNSLSLLAMADPRAIRNILADRIDSFGEFNGAQPAEAMDLAFVVLHYFWATLDYPFMVQHGAAWLIKQSRLVRSDYQQESGFARSARPAQTGLLLGETVRISRLIDQARPFDRLEEQTGLTRAEMADLASLAGALRMPAPIDEQVISRDFQSLRRQIIDDWSGSRSSSAQPAIDPLMILSYGYQVLAGLKLSPDHLTLSPQMTAGLDRFSVQFLYCSSRIQLAVASGQGHLALLDGPAQAIQIYADEYMLEDDLTFAVQTGFYETSV